MGRWRPKIRENLTLSGQAELDKNDCLVLKTCSFYLERLISRYSQLDQETLGVVEWIQKGSLEKIGRNLLKEVQGERWAALTVEIEEDPEDLPRILSRFLIKSGKAVQAKARNFILTLLQQRSRELGFKGKSNLEKSLQSLKRMFHLDDQEVEFCLFHLIVLGWKTAEGYFIDYLHCDTYEGRKYLATLLKKTPKDLEAIFSGTLTRIGLLEVGSRNMVIQDDYLEFLYNPSGRIPTKNFFTPLSGKPIPLDHYLIEPAQTDHLLKLLKDKPETSTHILLYGPPGTGKSSYVQGLAKALKLPAYEIIRDEENTTQKRRAAIIACLNMTNQDNGSLIVVDEADNILNTRFSWFSRGETQDKGWLNQLLEEPGARMIWISNTIDNIEESVLRRFAFSLQFKPFTQRQRIQLWESVLRSHKAKGWLEAGEIIELAKKYKVSAGAISLAVKKALEAKTTSKKEFKLALTLALEAHQTLLNQGEKPVDKNQIEKAYSLEGLNIEGEVDTMISQLKAFDHYLRQAEKDPIMNMNLLFPGAPGTGKSELARYIAGLLDREIIVKRASDLQNPFIGMTEKYIRQAFDQAEREEAVLIIDEADTFLFKRDQAFRSWEISFTNEFLTQMERFRGLLICTTNRLSGLDQASIRRFNYKIKFNYLTPGGNIVFYQKLLSPLFKNPLPIKAEASLKNITDLAPGDFKIVRDHFSFIPEEKINHSNLVQALKAEADLKKSLEGRKVLGF
jgi:transitional endoplasmic reticulum ATPase